MTAELKVNINTDEVSAIVQVDATDRGGLPVPRMTTTQRDAISAPATGLLIFNSTTNSYDVYNGSSWVAVTGAISAISLSLTGTGGLGYLQALAQSSNPSAPSAAGFRLFPDVSGYLAWREKVSTDTYTRTLGGVLSADRTYTLPDVTGVVQIGAVTSTATAAGTTTLTKASTYLQIWTGTTTQTVKLPDATTLVVGWSYLIRNKSTGAVTVQDNAGGAIVTLAANQEVTLFCTNTGSAAGAWDAQSVTGSGARVNATSPTLVTPILGVAAGTTLVLSGATDATIPVGTFTALSLTAATVSNKALTSNVATITTSAAHGLVTGQTVKVTIDDSIFNGTYVIASTPLTTTFTYAITHADVASAAATGTATLIHTSILKMLDTQGATKFALDSNGHVAFGTTVNITNLMNLAETVADPASGQRALLITETVTLSANNSATLAVGTSINAVLNQGSANATASAPGAVRGNTMFAQITGASGTVTAAAAAVAQVQLSGGGTLTSGYGYYLIAASNSASTLTSYAGFVMPSQTTASNNTYLLLGTATIPSGNWGIYVSSANDSSLAGKLAVGRNASPLATLDAQVTDAGTTTVIETAAFVRNSSGTPAAGLGGDVGLYLKSSSTADTLAARLRWYWNTATHASRKAYGILSAYDTAERDAIGWGANGSAALLGFYPTVAAAPVVQPTAPTTQLTTITFTSPGTPDYAIQDLVNVSGYGFVTADEGNTLLSVVANLQTRVAELQTKLEALGLIA